MDVNTMKTVAVFAVIFGCFAVLYPKIFHPILMQVFGFHQESNAEPDFGKHMPPHLRKPGMQGTSRPVVGGGHDDAMRHIKQHAGPHPGMRAAAEMQKQAGASSGRGGGMMGVVLPMYAIGIVLYLIYTLSKVFGGKKKKQEDEAYVRRRVNSAMSNVRYNADRRKFMYGEQDSEGEDDEEYTYRQNKRKQKDLERLLFKADKDKISELEMRELKKRLLETEAQMSRILQAMESVSDKVTEHTDTYLDEGSRDNTSPAEIPGIYGDQYDQQEGATGPYQTTDFTGHSDPSRDHSGGRLRRDYEEAYGREEMAYSEEPADHHVGVQDLGNDYGDDFEESGSEIEENIAEEESDGENVYSAREQGDGEESAYCDGESRESGSGKYPEYESESGSGESYENESENMEEESLANESGSEEYIGSEEQYIDAGHDTQHDLRKRTMKGDPRSSED